MTNNNKLSLIVGLFGRYEKLCSKFDKLVSNIKELESDIEIIIVSDGKEWTYAPLYQMIKIFNPNTKFIVLEERSSIPAVVFKEGLKYTTGEYIMFSHLFCENTFENIKLFNDCEEYSDKVLYIKNNNTGNLKTEISIDSLYGYLLSCKFISLSDVIIKKQALNGIEYINTNLILQKDFDRLLLIKLASKYKFKIIGETLHDIYSLDNYPFIKNFRFSQDIVDRYLTYNTNILNNGKIQKQIDDEFIGDLNLEYLTNRIGSKIKYKNKKYDKFYKITVLGGYWEHHHNQICFFNYFNRLAGEGFCTYKTLFEYDSTIDDIKDSDLVIFSRCRSTNMLTLLDYCKENNIPTLYMIDDNWISLSKDYPDTYGKFLKKGNLEYDNFIKAISSCNATMCYNDLVKEDLSDKAKKIIKFEISIEHEMFKNNNARDKNNDEIYIGFAGSMRWDNTAFIALGRIARRYKNIKLFLLGTVSSEQKKSFKDIEYISIPFSNYSNYINFITQLNPDIIIAPLNKDRSSMSKCYNKYIESGILSCIGIYSKQKPYIDVINDGENGVFVEDESVEGWYKKLEETLLNVKKLRRMQKSAYDDVYANYLAKDVSGSLANIIINLVDGGIDND